MTVVRRWMIASLALLALLALLVGGAEAQTYRAWPNDQLGRPAPPCMLVDPTTGITTPCTSTNPIPVSTGAGGAITIGGANTGNGQQWWFSNYQTFLNGSGGQTGASSPALFITDAQLAVFHRNVGGGNVLNVAVSPDGGINFQDFNTGFVVGNSLTSALLVPATPNRILLANNVSQVFTSTALLSGWATGTWGGTGTIAGNHAFASNADGSRVLSVSNNASVTEVCISTTQGQTFGSCQNLAASTAPAGIAWGAGTTWLALTNSGQVYRSTNNGTTFTLAATVSGGTGSDIVCLSTAHTTCVVSASGQISYSTDSGATWTPSANLGSLGTTTNLLCDYGSGIVADFAFPGSGSLASTFPNAWTSINSGVSWLTGKVNGTTWNGAGTPSMIAMTCRASRGFATAVVSTNTQLAWYNPVNAQANILQSGLTGIAGPVQGAPILLNSQTTGAANTAVPITLTGSVGQYVHVYGVTARCGTAADVATLTITDAGTTIWSSAANEVTTANYAVSWPTGLTFSNGGNAVITLGACTVGTGTVIVQADRF